MATLRERLADAVLAALKGGDALLNLLLAGSGSTLNVEIAAVDGVRADPGLVGHGRVYIERVQRVPFPEGELRGFKRRVYPFLMEFKLVDDAGINVPALDLWQALDRIFRDPRTFFRDYVTDTEANLSAKAGRLELEEDFEEVDGKNGSTIQCRLLITVTQKANLTD